MSLGTRLLILICPALLPPAHNPDNDEQQPQPRDYYDVLELPVSCTQDDIRKAYRQKSLQLHPDKVAQRRQSQSSAAQAAAEYEQVQVAYAVLVDEHQRQVYHATGRSVARYQFLTSGSSGGGITNPVAVYENLSKASCGDKTRLVVLLAVLLCGVLLQPILIAAKVNAVAEHQAACDMSDDNNNNNTAAVDCGDGDDDDNNVNNLLDTKWTVLLIPLWILHGTVLAFWMALAVLVPAKVRGKMLVTVLEQALWLIGFILTARAWDGNSNNNTNWHVTFVPFYAALALQLYAASAARTKLRAEQDRMVSLEFLQAQERDPLTEERLVELAEEYIIVTVDHEAVATTIQVLEAHENQVLSPDDVEVIRVQSSTEYEMNEHIVKALQLKMTVTVLVAIPFVALVASRLEEQITCSWWIVFMPIWIYFGGQLLGSCLSCCFVAVPHEDEVILMQGDGNDDGATAAAAAGETEGQSGSSAPEEAKDSSNAEKSGQKDQSEKTKNVEKGEGSTATAANEGSGQAPAGATKATEKSLSAKEESVNWAKPEGSIDEFKQSPEKKVGAKEASEIPAKEETENRGVSEPIPEEGEAKEEEPHFAFDEEAFHAWQSAYAQAEESAMEKQAKAQSTCCLVCFQLLIVCLIVGKLEQDYENYDGDAGYNAFWILFPIFLIAGILLCCCSCLIYGAGAEGLDELVERAKTQDDDVEQEEPNAAETTNEATPESKTAVDEEGKKEAIEASAGDVEEGKVAPAEVSKPVEEEKDINDLD